MEIPSRFNLAIIDITPENREDKLKKAIEAVSKTLQIPATIEQKPHNKEEFPFKAQEQLYKIYKNKLGIMMDDLYSRVCSTLGMRPANTFSKAIDTNAPKLGKEILWNPETGQPIGQKELDRLLVAIDKFMNRDALKKEFTLSQAAISRIIANLKNNNTYEELRKKDLHNLKINGKTWDKIDSYKILKDIFPGNYERLEFRERVVGNYIQDISEKTRKNIRDVLDQGFMAGKSKSQISQEMFDKFGSLNKDWDRLVDTEGVNIFNAEFIDEELKDAKPGEPVYFIRREYGDAKTCSFCRKAVNKPIIARWSNVPLQDEKIKDPIASIAIWEGKSNFGKNRSDWWWAQSGIHPNCYSDDTEVLTDNGWKLFKDVDITEKIMSINPETREVDYLNHKGLISYQYEGDMVHFTGRTYDTLVTPDHNCLYAAKGGRGKSLMQSKAIDLIGKDVALPKAVGQWKKGDDAELYRQAKSCGLSPENYTKLWGWFLSEGNVRTYGKRHEIKLAQKDPNNILLDLESDTRYKIGKGAIYIFDRKIVKLFAEFNGIHAEQKYIPLFLRKSSVKYINIFINTFMLGDGTVRTKRASKSIYGSATERIVRTSSPVMMSQLSEMIIKMGKFCSIKKQNGKGVSVTHRNGTYVGNTDCYIITITKSKHRHYNKRPKYNKETGLYSKEIEIKSYSGMVYDVELEKWHFLLVKRNGKLAWSGNCRGTWSRYYEEIGDIEL